MKEHQRNEKVNCKIAPRYMADEKRKCDDIFIFAQNEPLCFTELSKLVTH